MSVLLSVKDLSVSIGTRTLVERISFDLGSGEVLSIVGESGSGKSMTAKALMGFLPTKASATGHAMFDGADLLAAGVVPPRGSGIGLIFQEPMTALTPLLTVGLQMTEALESHGLCNQAEAHRRAVAMFDRVGTSNPEKRIRQYPHELSGGMRQRVVIAMMMLRGPRVLIADEPTTALDVTVQAQILDHLREIVTETQIGLFLITYDMGVVAEIADHVLVIKSGSVQEHGPEKDVFSKPQAMYTRALLDAIPRIDSVSDRDDIAPDTLLPASHTTKTFKTRTALLGRELQSQHRAVQMVFQDPYASLDPRQKVGRTIEEPMIIHDALSKLERATRVQTLIGKVGLSPDMARRYPRRSRCGTSRIFDTMPSFFRFLSKCRVALYWPKRKTFLIRTALSLRPALTTGSRAKTDIGFWALADVASLRACGMPVVALYFTAPMRPFKTAL